MEIGVSGFGSKPPNKYRRAFDWRISAGGRESPEVTSKALVRLASSDFPDILEDFLDIARRRQHNRTALARLQMAMLQELLVQEAAVKHYRQKLKDLQGSWNPNLSPDPPSDIRVCEIELFLYRAYANAIRLIGDSIAWRSLGFDRAVTRLMSERATKQNVLSEGLMREVYEWALAFDKGIGIAIFNALTNCLAIGDVTIVRDDESVEIREVKSSNTKSGRKIRQKHAMQEVVTILSDGAGQVESRDVQIEIAPITPQTGLDKIEELLNKADAQGWAAGKLSNCLYVQVIDFRKSDKYEESKKELERAYQETVGIWESRGDFVFDMHSLDALAFSPNHAPFSVFPFRTKICVDLMIGAKLYSTYLNLHAVAREFEFRGWKIEKMPEELFAEGNKGAILKVAKGGIHANIPPSDFMRMQMEALRPQTLIELYEQKRKEGPNGSHGYSLTLFSGEAELWK